MKAIVIWASAAGIAVAGCAESGPGNAAAANASSAAFGEGNAASPSNPGNEQKHDRHGNEADTPRLLLAANGIMPGGTEEGRIAFGTDGRGAITRVGALLGPHDSETSTECGAGPMEFASFGRVVLMLQQGRLVGWELREASQQTWIGTPGGVTIGTPRSELQAALGAPPAVERSSLGVEFSAGGFHGLLSADTPEATVTALWAGTNCIMR